MAANYRKPDGDLPWPSRHSIAYQRGDYVIVINDGAENGSGTVLELGLYDAHYYIQIDGMKEGLWIHGRRLNRAYQTFQGPRRFPSS